MRTSRLSIVFMSICLLFVLSACGDGSTSTARTTPTPTLPAATQKPSSKSTPMPAATAQASSGAITDPIHIKIPAINVDTDIEPVGVLPNGNMDTPQRNPWADTGWYNSGTRPGELGSAVIDGHVDRPGGGPAIFWNLRNMKPGDKVLITTRSGQHLSFHTTRSEAIPPKPGYLQGIFGDSSGHYLNLITCAGVWVPSENQTTLRMVVYTKLDP